MIIILKKETILSKIKFDGGAFSSKSKCILNFFKENMSNTINENNNGGLYARVEKNWKI